MDCLKTLLKIYIYGNGGLSILVLNTNDGILQTIERLGCFIHKKGFICKSIILFTGKAHIAVTKHRA